MRVYLDGTLIDEAGSTLGRAIEAARARAGTRMLVQAVADGAPVPAADLDDPPGVSPYASELRFASADSSVLLLDTLRETAEMLSEVKELQSRAAELLQTGKVDEAVAEVGEVLETWRTVKEAIVLVLKASPADRYHGAEKQELSEAIGALASALGEIKRAMSVRDWASLGDSLAYDMGEHADRCRAWLIKAGSGQ